MSLLTDYRPQKLDEVIGHELVIRALRKCIKTSAGHCFLFTGPSGVGKTTLARIMASELGCRPENLSEIDAASNTGIDAMRAIADGLQYMPLHGEGGKAVILDECHALTPQAWKSLLKVLEDPPAWVYWMLCTTEPGKVPGTARTRAITFDLKPVKLSEIVGLLEWVAKEEKVKLPSEVITLCAREAKGSPRQALANLAACLTATSQREAVELLQSAIEESQAIELARALYKGAPWPELQRIIRELGDADPESVRHVIRAYGTKLVLNAGSEQAAGRTGEVLDHFSEPFRSYDGLTPIVMACLRISLS